MNNTFPEELKDKPKNLEMVNEAPVVGTTV